MLLLCMKESLSPLGVLLFVVCLAVSLVFAVSFQQ